MKYSQQPPLQGIKKALPVGKAHAHKKINLAGLTGPVLKGRLL